jgi:hypothetical protein
MRDGERDWDTMKFYRFACKKSHNNMHLQILDSTKWHPNWKHIKPNETNGK